MGQTWELHISNILSYYKYHLEQDFLQFYKINPLTLTSANCNVIKFSLCQPPCTIQHDCMLGYFDIRTPLPWTYLEFKSPHHGRLKGTSYAQPMHYNSFLIYCALQIL